MIRRYLVAMSVALATAGCSVVSGLAQSDERYMKPGALDGPTPSAYATYSYKFMRRYRVTHDWVRTTPCWYRAREVPEAVKPHPSDFWDAPEIYEEDGKTWQGSNIGGPPKEIDRLVTSVKVVSRARGEEGQLVEVGNQSMCEESWWTSSHFLVVRLRRGDMESVRDNVTRQALAAGARPEAVQWTRRMLNGIEWLVLHVSPDQLIARRPNSIGGPFETWIAPLADTGYSISFTLGASKESLDFPQAHAAFQATFMRLVNSLRVEPLPR